MYKASLDTRLKTYRLISFSYKTLHRIRGTRAASLPLFPRNKEKISCVPFHKDGAEGQESAAERRPPRTPYKEDPHITYIPTAQDIVSKSSPNNLKRTPPGETSLTTTPSSSLNTKSATEKTEDDNSLVFIMDVKSNKHQIKQAEKKLEDSDMAKVNTRIRPGGERKANVPSAPDISDVANKIGII
ncbi:unnamed protein product [Gulo gulo]|uniref:Uncharacterized protein n=1 Tax=Gulo gulo TaxID=48420 RepID=A0A9X9Q8P6_GULGU|nr:unnamed protein product [Gulo gulo]